MKLIHWIAIGGAVLVIAYLYARSAAPTGAGTATSVKVGDSPPALPPLTPAMYQQGEFFAFRKGAIASLGRPGI